MTRRGAVAILAVVQPAARSVLLSWSGLAVLALGLAACRVDRPVEPAEAVPATVEEMHGPWRADPLVPNQVVLAEAEAACRARLKEGNSHHDATLLVADARGQGLVSLWYAASEGRVACPVMQRLPDGRFQVGDVYFDAPIADRPDSNEVWVSVSGLVVLDGAPGGVATYVLGESGSAVARVAISPAGAQPLFATVGNGHFTAWWPGQTPGRIVFSGLDLSGQQISSLEESIPE